LARLVSTRITLWQKDNAFYDKRYEASSRDDVSEAPPKKPRQNENSRKAPILAAVQPQGERRPRADSMDRNKKKDRSPTPPLDIYENNIGHRFKIPYLLWLTSRMWAFLYNSAQGNHFFVIDRNGVSFNPKELQPIEWCGIIKQLWSKLKCRLTN